MQCFRGYIPTRDKQAMQPFKERKNLPTLEEVQDLDEYAGVLSNETILIDVDDAETSELLFRMVQDLELKCRVYATTRGKHFLFKNTYLTKSWTKGTLAVGITTDGKVGANNSYEILKFGGVERPILYDFPEGEIQELPKWLTPVKSNYDFPNLGEGDGRNQTLFNYILTLQSDDFTKEEARECIRLINRYVLKKPLSDKELDVILRDDAFQKQAFFKGTKFLHDKFATYLKNDCHIIKINGQLHTYQDGVYRSGIEAINRAMVKILPGIKKAQRSEVIDYLNIICDERQSEPPTRIAFSNGVYDLADEVFKDFSPDMVITNQIPWPYNPAAYSEVLDHTLNRLACDDAEVRALLEEMVGSCFYRSNNLGGGQSFMLSGEGRNGKSTLLKLLQATLSYKNISSIELKQLTEKFANAELVGKLANIGDDIGSEYISDASAFKKLVTGDRIQVQRKGQDPFDFNNYAKLIFSANNIPRIGGGKDSIAVERRIVVVPFNAKFTPDDPDFDPEIIEKLKNQEVFEYLILLGLQGLKRVRANGKYSHCTAADKAKEEYIVESNPVLIFISEEGEDSIVNEPTSAVYQRYKAFCYTGNYQPLSPGPFSKQVNKALNLYTKQQRVIIDGISKNRNVFARRDM